ncbi:hypothetical protein BX667DRAFT_522439 [Coemansia mojavensis]|nr:hypothetical protein BX667DRAFT_522439 [Coemansia mojavensis]
MTVAYVFLALLGTNLGCTQTGIAAYFSPGDNHNFCGKLDGSQQSSQRASIESILWAIIKFKVLMPNINGDSTLVIRSKSQPVIEFINNCRAQLNGGHTEDIMYIPSDAMEDAIVAAYEIINSNFNVELEHVHSHAHMVGIEMAHAKATKVASLMQAVYVNSAFVQKDDTCSSGVGVYFGPGDPRIYQGKQPGTPQTAITALLEAVFHAVKQVHKGQTQNKQVSNLVVKLESQEVINYITTAIAQVNNEPDTEMCNFPDEILDSLLKVVKATKKLRL